MDSESTDKKAASQPFSIGSRGCVGRRYVWRFIYISPESMANGVLEINSLALMELRVILAKMLWTYDMHAVNPEFNWLDQKAFVLWEKPELVLRYTRRAGIVVPPIDG